MAYGTFHWGANVACGDVDGGGMDEIVTGPGPADRFAAHVRSWNYDGLALEPISLASFFAFPPEAVRHGSRVAAGSFREQICRSAPAADRF